VKKREGDNAKAKWARKARDAFKQIRDLCASYYKEPKPNTQTLIQDIWRTANFAEID